MSCDATGGSPGQIRPADGTESFSHGDADCTTHPASVTSGSDPLAVWHRRFPGLIAGSVHEVGLIDRPAFTRLLSMAGLTVHVHATAGERDAGRRWLAVEAAHPSPIDVHVIGSEAFVDDVLPAVLAARPRRVFLPWSVFTDRRADIIRGADVRAWITLWDEWDGTSVLRWPADPDGVLVMLAAPGTNDSCRAEQQLKVVSACTSLFPAFPVMVEGGVTQSLASLCVAAGVQQMVVGRALLNTSITVSHAGEAC
jgi:pentose-5-phosphate-3-epimerase